MYKPSKILPKNWSRIFAIKFTMTQYRKKYLMTQYRNFLSKKQKKTQTKSYQKADKKCDKKISNWPKINNKLVKS